VPGGSDAEFSGTTRRIIRSNGVPLTRTYLSERLRRLLSDAGIPGNLSSHSFRIGAATSAALAGVPDNLIQTLGRWSSSAYLTYIRTPRSLLSNLTKS
jgi:site-specific recombinase XerD